MKKYAGYALLAALVGYLTINYFHNKQAKAALAQGGITLKGAVETISYAKGTATLTVQFAYANRLLRNECRTNNYAFKAGDSVRIKILPYDPTGPCALQE